MAVILDVDEGENTTFDTTSQLRYKRPLRKESAMPRQFLSLACVLVFGSLAQAQDFEFDTMMYRGDPKGSKEAGTLKEVSAPIMIAKSGETASLLVGGQ